MGKEAKRWTCAVGLEGVCGTLKQMVGGSRVCQNSNNKCVVKDVLVLLLVVLGDCLAVCLRSRNMMVCGGGRCGGRRVVLG